MSNHFVWPKSFVKILNVSTHVILIKMVCLTFFFIWFFILLVFFTRWFTYFKFRWWYNCCLWLWSWIVRIYFYLKLYSKINLDLNDQFQVKNMVVIWYDLHVVVNKYFTLQWKLMVKRKFSSWNKHYYFF